jgi:hypothetical protein
MGRRLLGDHVGNLQWRWKGVEDKVFERCSDGVWDAKARTDLLRFRAGLDHRWEIRISPKRLASCTPREHQAADADSQEAEVNLSCFVTTSFVESSPSLLPRTPTLCSFLSQTHL